jgi:hypothetical protein
MQNLTNQHLAQFAGLVAAAWSNPDLAERYKSNPQQVLGEQGILLPEGVPAPEIPPRPGNGPQDGGWQDLSFEEWDVTIQRGPTAPGGITPELSISSLACLACPVSCFSSVSN